MMPLKPIAICSLGLLFSLTSFACSSDNHRGAAAESSDIAGTYQGWIKIENDLGNISADDPESATITKESDDTISVEIFKNHDYWEDDFVFSATMTSDTTFKAEQVQWSDFTFDATGSFNGSELTITFSNGAEGDYKGKR
jgi:hypothetical protein